ncbi:MAG TPA: hypothetical protein VGJ26_01830, partial [Pirellulales bacterium]
MNSSIRDARRRSPRFRASPWLALLVIALSGMLSLPLQAEPAKPLSAKGAKDTIASRRYSDLAYATTHNAMSNSDERWLFPNQHHGIARQLQDGVRGLMLDVHYEEGKPYL